MFSGNPSSIFSFVKCRRNPKACTPHLFVTGGGIFAARRNNIKALSIVRPSGSRIASGEKTIEVRRWEPNLASSDDLLIVENGRFLHREGDKDENGIPVAIVKVTTVRPFTLSDMEAACASYFEEGWLAWELTDVRPIQSPVAVIAARGIYEVDFLLSRKS